MLYLNKIDENIISIVQKHVERSFDDITNKWKSLPRYICNAHIPLLQATQLVSFYNLISFSLNCFLNL